VSASPVNSQKTFSKFIAGYHLRESLFLLLLEQKTYQPAKLQCKSLSGLFLRHTKPCNMNHPLLTIIAIALMAPFTVLVVALNMNRSNQRYLSKLKQQADKKQNRKNQ